jgi:hypothetical protein
MDKIVLMMVIALIAIIMGIFAGATFARTAMPRTPQEHFNYNLAALSADADCTDTECALAILHSCETAKKIVVPHENHSAWVIEVRKSSTDNCLIGIMDKYILDEGNEFILYNCAIPTDELATLRKVSVEGFLTQVITLEPPRCGVSMP